MSLLTATTGWVDGFLLQLLAFAARATVILLVAWGATALLRRASAATRHMIWTTAIAGVLALPLITYVVPAWNVPLLTMTARVPTPAAAVASPTVVVPRGTPAPTAPVAGVAVTRAPQTTPPEVEQAVQGQIVPQVSARGVMIGLWLALALLLLARLAVATTRLSLWRRTSRLVEDSRWLALSRRLTRSYGIERPVVLLENAETDVPVTWGIVYPVILLPANAHQWDEEQRVAVLTHELAHVKRFDALSQLFAQVALALLWFHPLVWMALRRMRQEREHACDDFVLVAGARASRYADDLLGLARRLSRPTAPAAAALAMARRSELEGRLLAILDPALKRTAVHRARVAFLTLVVLVLSTPLAAFTPAARVAIEAQVAETSTRTASLDETPAPARQETTPANTSAQSMVGGPRQEPVAFLRAPARDTSAFLPMPLEGSLRRLSLALANVPEVLLQRPDTEPVRHAADLQTLIDITRATKKMTSDYDKSQMLAQIAKRYQPDDSLRDAYLDVVFSLSSDYERGNALIALLTRDSLPVASTARVLQSAKLMSSDNSRATVLKRINPAALADSLVQKAYLDVIVAMSSNTERANAISSLVKQRPLTPAIQLGLIRAIALMSTNTEKANVLLLFLDNQGIGDSTVRRSFIKAAESLSSDYDYRRVMGAVLR